MPKLDELKPNGISVETLTGLAGELIPEPQADFRSHVQKVIKSSDVNKNGQLEVEEASALLAKAEGPLPITSVEEAREHLATMGAAQIVESAVKHPNGFGEELPPSVPSKGDIEI